MKPDSIEVFDTIADGLADAGYACVDDFMTTQEVDAILQAQEFDNGLSNFKKAGTGRSKHINEGIRGDYIQWVSPSTASIAVKMYLSRLNLLREFVNRALFLSLKDYEVHTTIYPEGSFYKRHLDQFKASDHRKLSVILYLNKSWKKEEGGQLRIYLPDSQKDIDPIAGRLVCFRSDQLEHEVLAATRDRLSLTGWMLDQLADLSHLDAP